MHLNFTVMSRKHMCCTKPFLAAPDMFNILGYHKFQFMTICFTYKHMKTGWVCFSIDFFDFNIMENSVSSAFETANNFVKSATADLLRLCANLEVEVPSIKNLKNGKIELSLLRSSHSNNAIFLRHTVFWDFC